MYCFWCGCADAAAGNIGQGFHRGEETKYKEIHERHIDSGKVSNARLDYLDVLERVLLESVCGVWR